MNMKNKKRNNHDGCHLYQRPGLDPDSFNLATDYISPSLLCDHALLERSPSRIPLPCFAAFYVDFPIRDQRYLYGDVSQVYGRPYGVGSHDDADLDGINRFGSCEEQLVDIADPFSTGQCHIADLLVHDRGGVTYASYGYKSPEPSSAQIRRSSHRSDAV